MEHQEYPKGEASMLRQRSLCIFITIPFANAQAQNVMKEFLSDLCNPMQQKGVFAVESIIILLFQVIDM
jgi:hypothetical protein